MNNIPIVGIAGLLALVWKTIDLLRMLANFDRQKSGVITQVLSWVGGILAVLLYANSDFADTVTIGGKNLAAVSGVTLIMIGVVLGSMASAAVDIKQAVDGNDSASMPKLIPDKTNPGV